MSGSVVAVATVTTQIVASSTSGALSYWRRGLIDLKLATALLRVGASGGGAAPIGALAIAGRQPAAALASTGSRARLDSELAARVTRLLRPPPGLPVIAVMLLGAIAALLVVAPAAALLLPL